MTKKNIAARRKLSELYVKGVELRFDAEGARKGPFDGPPAKDEVAIWVQPPSPLQREMALRDAQAARSRATLNARRDQESEEYLTAMAFIEEMDIETLIDYILLSEQDDRYREALRDVLARDEWEEFTTLQDAMRQFDEADADESDPEFAALLEKDREFGKQVADRQEEVTEAARDVLSRTPLEVLQKKAVERRAELSASQVFMKAYERHMLFYGCRDPEDHRELFFEHLHELLEQPDYVIEQLGDALAEFITDGGQAKNSPRAASSSESSTPPDAPETSDPSTPEMQSA